MKRLRCFLYLLGMVALFCVDRITKAYARTYFIDPVFWNDMLSFHVSYNRGISWGMLHSDSSLIFYGITGVIMGLIGWLLFDGYQRFKAGGFVGGHLLMISGATSNVVDRFMFGGVVDFIIISYRTLIGPSFNVADMAIVCGALLLFITLIREP